jgi:hypothetical protein
MKYIFYKKVILIIYSTNSLWFSNDLMFDALEAFGNHSIVV